MQVSINSQKCGLATSLHPLQDTSAGYQHVDRSGFQTDQNHISSAVLPLSSVPSVEYKSCHIPVSPTTRTLHTQKDTQLSQLLPSTKSSRQDVTTCMGTHKCMLHISSLIL